MKKARKVCYVSRKSGPKSQADRSVRKAGRRAPAGRGAPRGGIIDWCKTGFLWKFKNLFQILIYRWVWNYSFTHLKIQIPPRWAKISVFFRLNKAKKALTAVSEKCSRKTLNKQEGFWKKTWICGLFSKSNIKSAFFDTRGCSHKTGSVTNPNLSNYNRFH